MDAVTAGRVRRFRRRAGAFGATGLVMIGVLIGASPSASAGTNDGAPLDAPVTATRPVPALLGPGDLPDGMTAKLDLLCETDGKNTRRGTSTRADRILSLCLARTGDDVPPECAEAGPRALACGTAKLPAALGEAVTRCLDGPPAALGGALVLSPAPRLDPIVPGKVSVGATAPGVSTGAFRCSVDAAHG